MSLFGMMFREPVSAWTHLLWFLAAVPALVPLWRAAGTDPLKRRGAMIFGASLVVCSAGSFLFHAVPLTFLTVFQTMDHVGIFLLIAGTVTPIGLVVLDGRGRLALVGGIWLLAFVGISLRLHAYPSMEAMTALYLFMGWIGCLAYWELARRLTHSGVRLLWIGGLFYSVGAILNGLHHPVLVPGWFEAHELFHLLVMAGSACHFVFIQRVVMRYPRRRLLVQMARNPLPVEHAQERVVIVQGQR